MDGVLIEGCSKFLRLVVLNFLCLISQLERRERIHNFLQVEFLFKESDQISQPMCMNSQILGFTQPIYLRVHTNLKSMKFSGKDDLSHNERNESTFVEIIE